MPKILSRAAHGPLHRLRFVHVGLRAHDLQQLFAPQERHPDPQPRAG